MQAEDSGVARLARLADPIVGGAADIGQIDVASGGRCFAQHQRGKGARFFHSSPAQALVFVEACADKGEALRREIAIKRMKNLPPVGCSGYPFG